MAYIGPQAGERKRDLLSNGCRVNAGNCDLAPAGRGWRALFLTALAVVTILMVVPPEAVPDPTADALSDKAQHAICFAGLMILACLAYRHQPRRIPALFLLAYGGAMEAAQGLSNIGRQASWGDMIADALGVCAGWAILVAVNHWRK